MLGEGVDISPRKLVGYVPITIGLVVAICWFFDANGVRYDNVYPDINRTLLFDPIYHSINMFLHFDHSHFAWNMRLLVPFGIVFTLLTSNRHVLVVVVFAQFLSNIISGIVGQFVFGASGVMLALIAASLVRSTGYAMQDAQPESVQTIVGTLLSLAALALFVIFLGAGGSSWIAHFHHFLGFLFGGAIESIYLFSGLDDDENASRGISRQVTR